MFQAVNILTTALYYCKFVPEKVSNVFSKVDFHFGLKLLKHEET